MIPDIILYTIHGSHFLSRLSRGVFRMTKLRYKRSTYSKAAWLYQAGLLLFGILLNFAFSRLAGALNAPLYLDSVGTILTGALGGYVPGILVGFITNFITGLEDFTNTYYGVLNVMIGAMAAFMAKRNMYRRFPHVLLTVLVFALTGGALGSVLTWMLYGGGFGQGITASLGHWFYDSGIRNIFWAQLSADFLIDLLDKGVSVVTVSVIVLLMPKKVRRFYNRSGWKKDRGLKKHTLAGGGHRGLSLRTKIIACVAAAICAVGFAVAYVSVHQYHDASLEEQAGFVGDLTQMAASSIDPEKVDSYLAEGEAAEGYTETKKALQRLWESSENIQFVYAYRILADGCHVVFDVDTPEYPGGKPGDIIPFDESFEKLIPDLLAGKRIDPIVTNDTYGWLLTAYEPVYNADGKCVCYAAADVSMPRLITNERIFVTRILSLFTSVSILLLAVGIYLVKYGIINPVNAMTEAASDFAYDSEEARKDTLQRMRELDIRTGDEIEVLYESLTKTNEDTVGYISESQKKNETINRLQTGLIFVMADMVESRDKSTGSHIRNTAEYVRIILEEMKREGFYADLLTDSYIEYVVYSAPLHDIGKIGVSDTILNKPGKLTDEEFGQMKAHTVIGGKMIDAAIRQLAGENTGYLKEARNLAVAHHEKWNGKGYPYGLKGEEIPLSARVMAVADVFDALISARVYKPGMPVDQALDIIRKESGEQFDPKAVQAFLNCEAQVRAVAAGKQKENPAAG